MGQAFLGKETETTNDLVGIHGSYGRPPRLEVHVASVVDASRDYHVHHEVPPVLVVAHSAFAGAAVVVAGTWVSDVASNQVRCDQEFRPVDEPWSSP